MLLRRRVPECARPVSLLKNSTRLRSVDDHVSKKRLKTTTTTTFHTLCWADVAFRSEWLILIKNFSNFPCTHTRQIDVTQATHKHTSFSTGLLLFFFSFFSHTKFFLPNTSEANLLFPCARFRKFSSLLLISDRLQFTAQTFAPSYIGARRLDVPE